MMSADVYIAYPPSFELIGEAVTVARVIVIDTPILLDELISNIDPGGKIEVAKLLGETSTERLIVVTNHDPVLLLKYTKRRPPPSYGEHPLRRRRWCFEMRGSQ